MAGEMTNGHVRRPQPGSRGWTRAGTPEAKPFPAPAAGDGRVLRNVPVLGVLGRPVRSDSPPRALGTLCSFPPEEEAVPPVLPPLDEKDARQPVPGALFPPVRPDRQDRDRDGGGQDRKSTRLRPRDMVGGGDED